MAAQAKDIKSLHQQINAIKKKGNPNSSSGTTAGGGMTVNLCPHYAVVGRSAPHKNNSCYLDIKKITDRRDWDCKLMDKKGMAWKDDN